MVVHVVDRRVVGQARENRAFGQRQLGYVLIEITVGRGLHAIAAVAEVDRIKVHGQDAVFVVDLILQRNRAENFIDLTLDRVVFLVGRVFNQLLRDRRAAVLVAADQPALDRAERALPVHAAVLVKAFVLDGDGSILQILRDFFTVDPLAAFQTAERSIQRFRARFVVDCIDKRVQIQAEVRA